MRGLTILTTFHLSADIVSRGGAQFAKHTTTGGSNLIVLDWYFETSMLPFLMFSRKAKTLCKKLVVMPVPPSSLGCVVRTKSKTTTLTSVCEMAFRKAYAKSAFRAASRQIASYFSWRNPASHDLPADPVSSYHQWIAREFGVSSSVVIIVRQSACQFRHTTFEYLSS